MGGWEVLQRELRGNRTKMWVQDPGGSLWLRKEPHPGKPYQSITETIALAIAREVGVPAPDGFPCRWTDAQGEKSGIVVRSFLTEGEDLALGTLRLGGADEKYNPKIRPDHTLSRIRQALQQLADVEGVSADEMLRAFAAVLSLDAWLGIQDRHPENWGTIGSQGSLRVAPFYDGAACLGSELSEHSLRTKRAKVEEYVAKCPSGFGNGHTLVTQKVAFREVVSQWGESTNTVRKLTKLFRKLLDDQLIGYLSAMPKELMPSERAEFILTVLRLRLEFVEGEVGK